MHFHFPEGVSGASSAVSSSGRIPSAAVVAHDHYGNGFLRISLWIRRCKVSEVERCGSFLQIRVLEICIDAMEHSVELTAHDLSLLLAVCQFIDFLAVVSVEQFEMCVFSYLLCF